MGVIFPGKQGFPIFQGTNSPVKRNDILLIDLRKKRQVLFRGRAVM
jgi:hypothetical protein